MIVNTILLLTCLVLIIGLCVFYFYRDPERQITKLDKVILSPADGRVVSVRRYMAGVAPALNKGGRDFRVDELAYTGVLGSDGTMISIHISPLDVHVIRSPADARIVYLSQIRGGLRFMREKDFEITNERVSIVLETAYGVVGLVVVGAPIASSVKLLRAMGSRVQAGERIARIRLGSLATVIIPDESRLTPSVSCGNRVLAGVTVLATQSEKPVINEECYTPIKSTFKERLYLVFLAAFAVLKLTWTMEVCQSVLKHQNYQEFSRLLPLGN